MVKALKRFGQHFLEPAWVRKVVEAIAPAPADRFLEIGPGTGVLTLALAPRVARVVAIEIDRGLANRLRASAPDNVTVIEADVLDADLPRLVQEMTAAGRPGESAPVTRVVGNLPYNVSSPVLVRVMSLAREAPGVSDATLMLQQEVADRVLAAPGSGDFGPLSIMVQLRSEPSLLLRLPPGAFRPVPRVRSAFVRLKFRSPRVSLLDEEVFVRLVRSVFTRRRKTIGNALEAFAAGRELKPKKALAAVAIDDRRRPGTLSLDEFASLANVFVRR